MVDRQDISAFLGNHLQHLLQRAAPVLQQYGKCNDLITCRFKERIYIVLIFIVSAAADVCLGDSFVDGQYFPAVNELFGENGLSDGFRQNLLAHEVYAFHINIHNNSSNG